MEYINKRNLRTQKLVALTCVPPRSCSFCGVAVYCTFRAPDTKIRENWSTGLEVEIRTHGQHGDLINLPLYLEGTKGGYKILTICVGGRKVVRTQSDSNFEV